MSKENNENNQEGELILNPLIFQCRRVDPLRRSEGRESNIDKTRRFQGSCVSEESNSKERVNS